MDLRDKYDTIVVGAGLNGLAAAVQLSSRGWRVLVLERAGVTGGAFKTGQLTLLGFHYGLYAMNLSKFAGSAYFAAHKQALLGAGLGLLPVGRSFASVFEDGRWLGVERDLARDAGRWQAVAEQFGVDALLLFALLVVPIPSWPARAAHAAQLRAGHHDDSPGAAARNCSSTPMSTLCRRWMRWQTPIARRSRAGYRASRCWWWASRRCSTRRGRRPASISCGSRCACCRPSSAAMPQAGSQRPTGTR